MSVNPSKLSQFWQELKRRRVVHVITVYASAAFVLIELVNNLTEPLNLPPGLSTIVVVILAVGFPLAIILAWIYDLTPEGIEKTKSLDEIEGQEKTKAPNAWRVATYVSFVVIAGLLTLNIVGGTKPLRAGNIQSLLVLPFENFTGDDQLDYVAAGMHSSLIGDMGQVSGLRIISKTTARNYKNMDLSLPEMATQLNADAVVEPTVMCYGDSVCIQISVITLFPEEKVIWMAEYKEEKSQIMSLYNKVTKQIASEVKVQLTTQEEQQLDESRAINSEAYDYYLKGLYYWDQFTPEGFQLAMEYFNKAIETDPQWALPYAGITYVWVAIHQFGLAPPSLTIPNMYENMNKALELDPDHSFVHYVNAMVNGWTTWDWEKSEQEFLKVLELTPNDAFGHMYYAHLLVCLNRADEALPHSQIALELDPLNPMIQALSTVALANAGEYEEAISMAEKALAVVPDHAVALANLSGIYAIIGEYRKSLEFWIAAFYFDEDVRNSVLLTYDEQGLPAAAMEFITQIKLVRGESMPMELAQLYTLAGDVSMALYWYDKGLEAHHPMMPYMNSVFTQTDPFKIDDPRFDSLILKLNIPLE